MSTPRWIRWRGTRAILTARWKSNQSLSLAQLQGRNDGTACWSCLDRIRSIGEVTAPVFEVKSGAVWRVNPFRRSVLEIKPPSCARERTRHRTEAASSSSATATVQKQSGRSNGKSYGTGRKPAVATAGCDGDRQAAFLHPEMFIAIIVQ